MKDARKLLKTEILIVSSYFLVFEIPTGAVTKSVHLF